MQRKLVLFWVIIVTMPVSCGRGLTSLNSTSSPRTNNSTPNKPAPAQLGGDPAGDRLRSAR